MKVKEINAMTKRVKLMFKHQYVYVYLSNGKLMDVCLPGDLLSIKEKLSEAEIQLLESRALLRGAA